MKPLSLLEIFTHMLEIVNVSSPEPNKPGCLEDAMMCVIYGMSWFIPTDFVSRPREEMVNHPAYKILHGMCFPILSDYPYMDTLWAWSDDHTKGQRIALLERAIRRQLDIAETHLSLKSAETYDNGRQTHQIQENHSLDT